MSNLFGLKLQATCTVYTKTTIQTLTFCVVVAILMIIYSTNGRFYECGNAMLRTTGAYLYGSDTFEVLCAILVCVVVIGQYFMVVVLNQSFTFEKWSSRCNISCLNLCIFCFAVLLACCPSGTWETFTNFKVSLCLQDSMPSVNHYRHKIRWISHKIFKNY